MKHIKVKLLFCILLLAIMFNCLNIQLKEPKEENVVLNIDRKIVSNYRGHNGGPII